MKLGWDEVMWLVLRWRGVSYCGLVAMWHVMSCHVIWCGGHVIWCDVIACVVSCHVMQCDSMVMSCYLLCTAMGWNVMSLRCHWLWGHVGGSKWSTPVLLCTAKNYSTTPVLLWTTKKDSWLTLDTYETSFTMRGATVNTLQPHQILRLPPKMNLRIDPHHIWNVIYNVRSNTHHPPTSPNTAPATKS